MIARLQIQHGPEETSKTVMFLKKKCANVIPGEDHSVLGTVGQVPPLEMATGTEGHTPTGLSHRQSRLVD